MNATGIARRFVALSGAAVVALVPLAARAAAAAPTASPGYSVRVFASGTAAYSKPDSATTDGRYIYIGYQNSAASDGTSGSSTVVQYRKDGSVVRTWTVVGKVDGLRINPSSRTLWAVRNEDGNAKLSIINPRTGSQTEHAFPDPAPHGGGYDDLAFTRFGTFVSASAPNPDAAGMFTAPAVDRIEVRNGKIVLTPVLMGNATATNRTTGQPEQLNLSDPDALAIDAAGELVLMSQGDSESIFIRNPGKDDQQVSVLHTVTQTDETGWVPQSRGDDQGQGDGEGASGKAVRGEFLITDANANVIYLLSKTGGFTPGWAYAEAPADSTSLAGAVGVLDQHSGAIAPVAQFVSPHAVLWLPTSGGDGEGD
jgi:hypothetical protein